MTAKTPGQLAYESSPHGWFRHGGTAVPDPYHKLDSVDRGFWECVAKAARAPLAAGMDQVKRDLNEALAENDRLAAENRHHIAVVEKLHDKLAAADADRDRLLRGMEALALGVEHPAVFAAKVLEGGTAPGRIMSGHGWVTPRADGMKARCGGPAICPECSRERAQANAAAPREMAPGQAAWEAHRAIWGDPVHASWDEMDSEDRTEWGTVARAACEAHGHAVGLVDLAHENSQLRTENERLRSDIAKTLAQSPSECCEHCDHDPGIIHRSACENCLSVQLAAVTAEKDKLQRACHTLGHTVEWHAVGLYAMWIDVARGDLQAVRQWVLNAIPDVDDNEPDERWNGKETGGEWLERTRDGVTP